MGLNPKGRTMSAENQAPDNAPTEAVLGGTHNIFQRFEDTFQKVPPQDPALELKAFSKGNKLWQLGLAKMLARTKYQTPEELLLACVGYFEWLDENPLLEGKLVTYEGVSTVEEVPKLRAPTLAGLCLYLGIHRDTWGSWRRGDARRDLQPVTEIVEQKMYDDKFGGAAAGLLHPMIVARDLGLVEKQQLDNKTTVVIDGDEANL